jgi:hypothetical protein
MTAVINDAFVMPNDRIAKCYHTVKLNAVSSYTVVSVTAAQTYQYQGDHGCTVFVYR